ncbi:MAG: helix-turn-helix transcriptional regulator [bacterium]|nr:helix-turn-helix transcriptional regulator [bacterium]
MLTATLGGLIKDYRIKKRLSQLKLALEIGWKDTTRLSKIEQGRVKPTRETLDKIMKALDVNDQGRNLMLLASGILPSDVEIQETIKRLKEEMELFNLPVILIDYAWRTFYFSEKARKVYKTVDGINRYLLKEKPSWMEVNLTKRNVLGVKVLEGYSRDRLLSAGEHEISLFKYEQGNNEEERWFKDLAQRMSKNEEFRQLWARVNPGAYQYLLYEYEYHSLTGDWGKGEQTLNFHLFCIHPTFDFRFYLQIFTPADESSYKLLQEIR